MRDALEERSGLASAEGLDKPAARLVTRLVLEPQDSLAVESGRAVQQANGMVGDLSPGARLEVPRVELPDSRFGRRVDHSVRSLGRPLREERDGRAEALLPGRETHRVRG
jgi:hypothetical protein